MKLVSQFGKAATKKKKVSRHSHASGNPERGGFALIYHWFPAFEGITALACGPATLVSILFMCLSLFPTISQAEVLERGPFIVDFHPDDRQTAEETLAYLEEAQAEFDDRLPLGTEPIQVRIASNMNEFLGLSGAYAHVGVSGVTRADQSLIALKSPRLRSIGDDYRGTVRHELLHVLLHRNTDTRKLPRWLNEGICMMLASELRWGTTLQVARMRLSGELMPLSSLDRTFATPGTNHQFGNAYAQALSMTQYLRKEVGEEKFWALIAAMKNDSFTRAMEKYAARSPQDFWQHYAGSLWIPTLISVLRTGSFWGAVSVLCVLAFLVRQWRNRAILRRWAEEDAIGEAEDSFDWDSILPEADDWKGQQ